MPNTAALLFSDLDGTLLDHETYSFDAARPALHRVQDCGIPLILNTSKTLVEVIDINRALHNKAPVIIENGGAMAFPLDLELPFELPGHEIDTEHAVVRFSPPYAEIRAFIEAQRHQADYRLKGFADLSADEVSHLTGLAVEEAAQARERLCSEPFLWEDSDERLSAFTDAAGDHGLRVTRGGRFHHLMGDTSKAAAMMAMAELFAGTSAGRPTLVALGDSENDIEMLQHADVAVVVMRPDGRHLECEGLHKTYKTVEPGPEGWNAAVEDWLGEFLASQGTA
jgi:mannosyl-3-phosphoglycerate phosphatase